MKIKSLKKVIASLICAALVFISAPQMSAFASIYDDLDDIDILGGSYGELIDQDYDHWDYQCHHLISKAALNKWGKYIKEKYGKNASNEFLVNDYYQNWGPSIIMEREDHEETLSYYNPETRTEWENEEAIDYIDSQAKRIIEEGDFLGVLRDEIRFIQRTFGDKYDRAIDEVCEYLKELRINRNRDLKVLTMRNPDNFDEVFKFTFGV